MPIKFACEHCGQVLSVSSTKAGKSAKCPKCHQGITVPTVEAALATLKQRKTSDSPAPVVKKAAAPPPPPPPPPPSTAKAPSPLPSSQSTQIAPQNEAPPLAERENSNDRFEAIQPPASDVSTDDDPFAEFVVYDDGAELVYASDEESLLERHAEIDRNSLAVPRGVLYLQGVLLAVVAVVCFTLGLLMGSAAPGPADSGPRVARPCQVSGSVAFRDRRQASMPDDGSVIILLPQDARPDERPPVLGLRPEDPTPDREHATLAAIRSLGGDYARADAQGRFTLQVADTGNYFVLVISRNNKRKPGESLKTADLAQLGRYFVDATDLIGENRYRWKVERVSGDRTLSEMFH